MKSILPKLFGILFLSFCLSTISLASEPNSINLLSTPTADSSWILQSELNGVKAYYQIATCENEQVVFLKLVNTNNSNVTVSWDDKILFTGETSARKVKTTVSKQTLISGETLFSTCTDQSNPLLISKPTESPIVNIESFQYFNLSVSNN